MGCVVYVHVYAGYRLQLIGMAAPVGKKGI